MRRARFCGYCVLAWQLVFFAPRLGWCEEGAMLAHFIDVGQGAATLLEFPCGAVLVDTGAADDEHVDALVAYLRDVFARRPDLHDTLAAVIVTHPHIDHARGLKAVANAFRVGTYIDDGQVASLGRANVQWIRDSVANGERTTIIREILDAEITNLPHKNGLTDEAIDPVHCDDCDPRIVILSGTLTVNPGWTQEAFDNLNNHSVVVRVDFGEASFLITGDLQEEAIATMVDYYAGTATLDVDVYQVGHHGSHNATTEPLLEAVTPELAVIGVGRWNDGEGASSNFTTFAYGHPRRLVMELLNRDVTRSRETPVEVMVGDGVRRFSPFVVEKAIYSTGWDGTVVLRATLDGQIDVETTLEARPEPTLVEAAPPAPSHAEALRGEPPAAAPTPRVTSKQAPDVVQKSCSYRRRLFGWRRWRH